MKKSEWDVSSPFYKDLRFIPRNSVLVYRESPRQKSLEIVSSPQKSIGVGIIRLCGAMPDHCSTSRCRWWWDGFFKVCCNTRSKTAVVLAENEDACLVLWPQNEVVPRIILASRVSESKSAELASFLQNERRLKGGGVSRLA